MDPEITKLIDQYLSGALNPEQLAAFERELAQSVELQNEVTLQRSIIQAAERASQRITVKEAAKAYKRKKMLRNGGLSALIAVAIASTIFLFSNRSQLDESAPEKEMAPISYKVKLELDSNEVFANIPIQYFQIPSHGSVQLSQQGVLISVPKAAFLKDGKPYTENVILQYQEAIRGIDIVTSGLSTMTGSDLLETQGMFSVTGYTEAGETLLFNPEVGVYLQAPVDDCKSGMQLYDGETLEDGSIDWVDPTPLEKIPTLVDMADLDFYPEGYEDFLDGERWSRDKQSRDSLYASLEHSMDLNNLGTNQKEADYRLRQKNEEVIALQEEMGRVYQKRKKNKNPLPGIDESILWNFSRELIGNDIWEITAIGNIAEGYHISTMNDPDSSFRTQLKITELNSRIIVEEEPYCLSKPKSIRTVSGTVKGYTDEVIIKTKVRVNTKYEIQTPVRVIFKLASKDLAYSRVMRGGIMTLWESPEERTVRYDSLANIQMNGNFILPSNVLGFWKPAFNNTLLSTYEFEERMNSIHATCDNEVLELYTANLNESMTEIDKRAVALGHPEFQKFADQNIGKIEMNDPHIQLLQEFYRKTTSMLREDAKNTALSEQARLKQWTKIVTSQVEKDRKQAAERNQIFADGMTNFSVENLRRQYQNSQGIKIRKGTGGLPTAIHNIDGLRPYAGFPLINRTAASLSGVKETILIEKIKYNELSVQVPNHEDYADVYMYLFANGINSYQRINKDSTGTFQCSLNDKTTYAIGIVGLTENGYAYYDHDFLKGGDLGKVRLKPIKESDLEKRIEAMNGERLPATIGLANEFKWLRTKRKNYQVKRMYKEMIEFRRAVKSVIFPCVTFKSKGRLSAEVIVEGDLGL